MKKISLVLIFVMCLLSTNAQITGKWKTVEGSGQKAKSVIEIYKKNGKLYGKVVKVFDPNAQNDICKNCRDYRKNKKILGMIVISGLKYHDGKWEGDDAILDPRDGETYDCKIWVDENNKNILNVRGYLGFFFKTQYWRRTK